MTGAEYIGIDTGPRSSWWARVRRGDDGAVVYLSSGYIEHGHSIAVPTVAASYAIECPEHAFSSATASAIIATARSAGEISGYLRAASASARVRYVASATWRRELMGVANAHDASVKAFVEAHVAQLPKRTNVHVRDALAIAYWLATKE